MRVLTSVDRRELEKLVAAEEPFWLDLEAPTPDELRQLEETMPGASLEPPTEAARLGRRPQIDSGGAIARVTFFGAARAAGGDPEPVAVELLVAEHYLVSARSAPSPELDELRRRVEVDARRGERFSTLSVLDALIGSIFSVLETIDDEIDDLEDAIVEQPSAEQLARIGALRRALVALRKVTVPQRDMLLSSAEELAELPGSRPDARERIHELYGHIALASELIDSHRELASGALSLHLAAASNRLNVAGERLTLIATVVLPLTVVTGFFGQNFAWMTDRIGSLAAFIGLGVGGLVVPLAVLLLLLRRRGYLQ